jgi:glycosyltransferase involved in cell wall biosynthesis
MRSVSVVIPNYNGAGLLEKYLPPLKKTLSDHVATFEIIVVDDASQDSSVEFLRQQHPGP